MSAESKSSKPMTLEETRDVLNQLDKEVAQVVLFLVLTGVHVNEAADLLWADIDFDNNLLTVTNNQTGKQRDVLILPIVKRALLNRKQTQGEENYVFGYKGKKDAALKQCIPLIKWKRAFEKLGLKVRKPEYLRKTFKSIMLSWGEAPELVENQLNGTKYGNPFYLTEPHNYVLFNDWESLDQKPKRNSYSCTCHSFHKAK